MANGMLQAFFVLTVLQTHNTTFSSEGLYNYHNTGAGVMTWKACFDGLQVRFSTSKWHNV